ncbi:hypothetical protein, conserved [Trypanosoma brucei brucei TREU927]|uniref:Uncharacterized protein n=1 Tax=Trypanosoma brucei brucei (strain 927/4 GUTat10.1) TaxID=185431 RepID=Q4GZ35_TRYB2|nr:hypothetical protein, conserved [Trypanosoma brucei brucei TREU927]CAJ16215.1 hypothetical protein, conserved [Trypanosoma brucei brucei TREU927]
MRPAPTDANMYNNVKKNDADNGLSSSNHYNSVNSVKTREGTHKVLRLGVGTYSNDLSKRTGAVTATNALNSQGNSVRTDPAGTRGHLTNSARQHKNAESPVTGTCSTGQLKTNCSVGTEGKAGGTTQPLKLLRPPMTTVEPMENLTGLISPLEGSATASDSSGNCRRKTVRNLPLIDVTPQPPAPLPKGQDTGGSKRSGYITCQRVKPSISLKSLSPNVSPPSTRVLPDVHSPQSVALRLPLRHQHAKPTAVTNSTQLEPMWKERGKNDEHHNKANEELKNIADKKVAETHNEGKFTNIIGWVSVSERVEAAANKTHDTGNESSGVIQTGQREDPSLVLAESCAHMWESLMRGAAAGGSSLSSLAENANCQHKGDSSAKDVEKKSLEASSTEVKKDDIVRRVVDLTTWAATPLLSVNDDLHTLLRHSAATHHQWCGERDAATKDNPITLERGGELKTLNHRVHNVIAQILHPKRPLQPSYPSRMPLVMEKVHGKRRAVSPLRFYGPKGKVIGPRWFESALDDAKRVASPNIGLLEAGEAEKAMSCKRS